MIEKREQVKYEQKLHDRGATHYNDIIVTTYGTKTKIITSGWAKKFSGPFLDYGCGTGQVSSSLIRKHSDVFAFDISSNSVRINMNKNKVQAIVADLFHLPFRDKSFRTICINGVMHHVIDLEDAFDEATRISSDFICISEPCIINYYPIWWMFIRKSFDFIIFLKKILIGDRSILRKFSVGSKYERPLDPMLLIKLLEERGFYLIYKKFYTDVDLLKDGKIKRIITRHFISNRKGTHFEICARHERV